MKRLLFALATSWMASSVSIAATLKWSGMRNPCKTSAEDGVTKLATKIGKFTTGVSFWGERSTNSGAAKALQVQPPHGAMWDYRTNKGLKRDQSRRRPERQPAYHREVKRLATQALPSAFTCPYYFHVIDG
jgi:hypothetical protein